MIRQFHLFSHLCNSMTELHSRARTHHHAVHAPAQLPQNPSLSPSQERFAQWRAILIAQSPRRGRLQSSPDCKQMSYFGPGAWRSSEKKQTKKIQSIRNNVLISPSEAQTPRADFSCWYIILVFLSAGSSGKLIFWTAGLCTITSQSRL